VAYGHACTATFPTPQKVLDKEQDAQRIGRARSTAIRLEGAQLAAVTSMAMPAVQASLDIHAGVKRWQLTSPSRLPQWCPACRMALHPAWPWQTLHSTCLQECSSRWPEDQSYVAAVIAGHIKPSVKHRCFVGALLSTSTSVVSWLESNTLSGLAPSVALRVLHASSEADRNAAESLHAC
jgi:hypothetical protein